MCEINLGFHLELCDEIISLQKFISHVFQGMAISRFVHWEHVKWPVIQILKKKDKNKITNNKWGLSHLKKEMFSVWMKILKIEIYNLQ